MSQGVRESKNQKSVRSANGEDWQPAFALCEATQKNLEDGLAALKSSAERYGHMSFDSWSAANEESVSYFNMMMDTARSNVASAVDLAVELANVRKPADFVAITTAHARRQMDTIMAQNRFLWSSAQKLTSAMSLGDGKSKTH